MQRSDFFLIFANKIKQFAWPELTLTFLKRYNHFRRLVQMQISLCEISAESEFCIGRLKTGSYSFSQPRSPMNHKESQNSSPIIQ
jgi:hypothetical protein